MSYHTIRRAIERDDAARVVPQWCRRWLAPVAQGRQLPPAVRHPLGFICLPVQRTPTYGVCVHLWTERLPQARSSVSTVHSHSWDLLSFVLYGQVGNMLIEVTDDRDGTHRVFDMHSRGEVDEVRATGRLVRYGARDQQITETGGAYRLPAGSYHQSVIGGGTEAATVALGRIRQTMDRSLGPPDLPTHVVARQRCTAAEVVEAARIVIAGMDEHAA